MPQESESFSIAGTMARTAISPDKILQGGMAIVRELATIVCAPLELALRPSFGTTYLNPISVFLSWILLQCLWIISVVIQLSAKAAGYKVHGLIGLSLILSAFDVICIAHLIRIRPLFLDMSLEEDSQHEGEPLWFLRKLPRANTWAWVRCGYEPGLLIALAILLFAFRIFDPGAAIYFFLAGVALWIKNTMRWFEGFWFIRKAKDNQVRAKILQDILTGGGNPQTIGSFVMSSIPKNATREERAAVAQHLTGLDSVVNQGL